jgi:putative PIG3 family NAD(P)H quinone oxidoreductase
LAVKTIPKSMHCIAHEPGGGPEVLRLEKTETPKPGLHDVLVEIKFAGINAPDLFQRAGKYPPPAGASPILGLEISGQIVDRGPAVNEWNIGDLVCALTPGGGYAEYCRVDASHCLPIPQGLDLAQAAALPENWFTVVDNLITRGRLSSGERVLIHGGSGGIGYTAIQLARECGATVFTTVGNETKRDFCRSLGATFAINYRTQDFVAEIEKATDGKGVNVILDIVGGDYFAKNLRLLALEGRLVQIAFLHGSIIQELDLMQVMARRLTITGSTLRPRTVEQKAALAQNVHKRVWPLLESGKIKVVIDRVLPMVNAAEGHRIVGESKHIGKVLLAVR